MSECEIKVLDYANDVLFEMPFDSCCNGIHDTVSLGMAYWFERGLHRAIENLSSDCGQYRVMLSVTNGVCDSEYTFRVIFGNHAFTLFKQKGEDLDNFGAFGIDEMYNIASDDEIPVFVGFHQDYCTGELLFFAVL